MPLVGLTISQGADVVTTFHFSVLRPVFVIMAVCGSGLPWPMMPVKTMPVGVTVMTDISGCPRTKVTGKVCDHTTELKKATPVYVPGVRPVVLTLTNELLGVIPFADPTWSHGKPFPVVLNAIQFSGAEHPWEPSILIFIGSGAGCW